MAGGYGSEAAFIEWLKTAPEHETDPELREAAKVVARHYGRWGWVKRDMEVIRAILAHVEGRTDLAPKAVELGDRDDLTVQAHVWMLHEEGMLNAQEPHHSQDRQVPLIFVRDLSWQGHELAAVLKETSWDRIKARFSASELGGMSLKTLLEVGTALGTAWMKQKLGLE